MFSFSKTTRILLAALALGGAALTATSEASARPGGGHGGGHGGGIHRPHHGGHGGGWHRPHHRPHHHGHWRGRYGYGLGVAYVATGSRCRLVERVNAYGDVVMRRVCFRPAYY